MTYPNGNHGREDFFCSLPQFRVIIRAMKPVRIELPTDFAIGPVNAYLFTEPEPILIDTGVKSEASWAALMAGLAAHGLWVTDLQRVMITHPHVDHCGQAARLAAESGALVEIMYAHYPPQAVFPVCGCWSVIWIYCRRRGWWRNGRWTRCCIFIRKETRDWGLETGDYQSLVSSLPQKYDNS